VSRDGQRENAPPRIAGRPLIFVSSIAVLFGAYEQDGLHALFSVPEGAFEAAFAIYVIVKGFRPSPVLASASAT
jgi:ABC-type arginine transport system permease subunit